jgi:hypothetical protein
MTLDTVIKLYIAALALVGIGGMFAMLRFVRHLKTNHPATWERLGKPGEYIANSPLEWVDVQPFIWRRRYAELDDPAMITRGDTVLYVEMLLIVGIVGLFVLVQTLNRLTTGS